MQAGDIVFVRGKGFLANAIRFFDKGDFTHCCIAVSDKEVLTTDIMTNAQIIPFAYDDYVIVDLKFTPEQRQKVSEIAPSFIGRKYNNLLVIWYIAKYFLHLKKPWTLPMHDICSELVDEILYRINVIPEKELLSGESPNELYAHLQSLTNTK